MSSSERPPSWVELVAAASTVYDTAIARLDIPMMVVDPASRTVRAANRAAAELLDVPEPDLVGSDAVPQLEPPEARRAVRLAAEALRGGALDGYQATYRLRRRHGTWREISVWCRAVTVDAERSAVYVLSDASVADERLSLWALPLEPLVVGTVDAADRIERVSSGIRDLLGRDAGECIGRPLGRDAHPDDVGALARAVENVPVGAMVARPLRLAHRDGYWVACEVLVIRLTADLPARLAFALLQQPTRPPPEAPDRVGELEAHLRRIAGELQAAGVLQGIDLLPSAEDHPELNRLTSRQWQILVRLMRGDRVPTIARELHLSPSTVRNYLAEMYTRFDVHSQAELLALLRRR